MQKTQFKYHSRQLVAPFSDQHFYEFPPKMTIFIGKWNLDKNGISMMFEVYYRNTKMFIPEVCRRKNIVKQLYIVGNDDDDGTKYQLDIILLQRQYYHHKRMKYLFWVLFITGNVHTLFHWPHFPIVGTISACEHEFTAYPTQYVTYSM